MRTRKPIDRNDLMIGKTDYVVEFGPGHNPNFRSNVLVEKFIDNNAHRCGNIKKFSHQKYYNEDGEKTNFKDKEFDYSICCQVMEHVEHPDIFIKEQMRIAKGGFIETPSLLGEFLFPKKSHKWVILDIDDKLVFFEKSKMPGNYENNYGELFLNYLPFQSLVYKLLWLTEGDLMLNRYEWKDSIDYIVNPEDDYYQSFFLKPWNRSMVEKLFPHRPVSVEITKLLKALFIVFKEKFFGKRHQLEEVDPNSILKA